MDSFLLDYLVKIGYNEFYVEELSIFCFADIANCSTLGLCMAACRAQNSTHADIKSRTASLRPFRYPGRDKNDWSVITPRFAQNLGQYSLYPTHVKTTGGGRIRTGE